MLIKNGFLIDPASDTERLVDLRITDGLIQTLADAGTESMTGEVFAIQITEVNPPAAAARDPVWRSSISKSGITEMNVCVNKSWRNHKSCNIKLILSMLRCVYDNTFSNKFESLSKIRYT